MKRVSNEPAFVLHRYDWSESSLILEVFTRDLGRIALVAKGAKKPSSNFRPVLLPLQPLQLTFTGDAEIRTLKAAQWMGPHVMPTGDALMSGYYLNELLLKLLARDDPHPQLFDVYAQVVQIVASEHGEVLQAALRSFELLLLREIGLLPVLNLQTMTLRPLDGQRAYVLVPEGGLREQGENDRVAIPGDWWLAIQDVLESANPLTRLLRACADQQNELKPQLRQLLNYHCGVGTLKTRQVMLDLQSM